MERDDAMRKYNVKSSNARPIEVLAYALAIGFAIVWLSGAALAQHHQHGSMPAGTTGDGQYNPFLATDNRGGFFLVYVDRKNNVSNVMLRHSPDGVSFSSPIRVNDREGDAMVRNENPPKVLVGPEGEVYVCWANERGKWKGNIRFARSTDGGKSFSPARTINSDGDQDPAGHAFQSMAVDRKGKLFIVWIDERNKQKEDRGAEIWLASSADRGKTFSSDRRIVNDVCECCRSNLQIDGHGNFFLTYRVVPREGPMYRDILLARSVDGGKTFASTPVSQDKWEINGCPVAGPALSLDSAGNLTTIWFLGGGDRPGLYYANSTDHGQTFSARRLLDPDQRLGKHTASSALSDGRVFVAWDDAAEKTFSAWGVLDPRNGRLSKSKPQEGVAYPVSASNGAVAVIAGMKLSSHEIVTYQERLDAAAILR
jgi:hypothetical protein